MATVGPSARAPQHLQIDPCRYPNHPIAIPIIIHETCVHSILYKDLLRAPIGASRKKNSRFVLARRDFLRCKETQYPNRTLAFCQVTGTTHTHRTPQCAKFPRRASRQLHLLYQVLPCRTHRPSAEERGVGPRYHDVHPRHPECSGSGATRRPT